VYKRRPKRERVDSIDSPPCIIKRSTTRRRTISLSRTDYSVEGKKTHFLSRVKGAETYMTVAENSTIIAVFVSRDQANPAIDNLRRAGYSYEQIRLVEHGTNSFVENLKSLFTGQTTTTTNSADDWMRIGVPEQDARNYQRELDEGRSIVLIKAVGNPEQALAILRQSGAYDIAARLRTAPPTIGAGTYNPNAQAGTYNPNVAPGANNPNVQPGTRSTQPQPRPTNMQGEPRA
jgi:hypothetical protein